MVIVLSAFSNEGGVPLDPQREPVEGDVVRIVTGGAVIEQRYAPPPPPSPPPPSPPPPPPEVRRVGKIDFIRLFRPEEERAFDRLTLAAQALTPANFDLPENASLVALRSFLRRYDPLSEIELTHPETIQGMALLVALNVVTQERADAILAGAKP